MTAFQTIFVSTDGRIRAGWRLLMQLVLSLLVYIPLSLIAAQFGGQRMQMVAFGAAVTIAVWMAGKAFDKRPMRDFGLGIDEQWWRDGMAGFLLATLVMSLIVLFQWVMGWIEFTGFGWNRASQRNFVAMLGGYVLTMAVVGFYEELWMRGYQLKNLTEGFYTGKNRNTAGLAAIVISSLIFGLLHTGNPNVTLLGVVVIMLAGVMLALPYVVTGQLGFSVGLHFAWNVIQGAMYGLPVSGIRFRQSVLQFEVTGPELWTGGRFGPEGGMLGVIGVLLLMLLTWLLLRRRGLRPAISEELVRPPSSPGTYD
jgi:uncharacterized protein